MLSRFFVPIFFQSGGHLDQNSSQVSLMGVSQVETILCGGSIKREEIL